MVWLDKLISSFRKEAETRYELVQNIEEQIGLYEENRRKLIAEIKDLESLPEKADCGV